jgi:hypothetical protein
MHRQRCDQREREGNDDWFSVATTHGSSYGVKCTSPV